MLTRIYQAKRDAFKHALRLSVALPISVFAYTSSLEAQAKTIADSVELAQVSQTQRYDIKGGSLDQVLNVFADKSNLDLLYAANIVDGFASNGLKGSYSHQQALQILLANTGLYFEFTDARTITIKQQQDSKAEGKLDQLLIEAEAPSETPWGSFDAYVANRTFSGAKTDTPINEMIQSVSVVTNEQMKERDVQTLGQALRYTAGVQPEVYGSETRYDAYFIRGFAASSLGRTRDGLSTRGGQWSFLRYDPYVLERVEVLRGPSSALYGDGSPGGLVNSVSKRPSDDPINELILSYGSFDNKQIQADIGDKLDDEGRLLFRLTTLLRDSDTHVNFTEDNRKLIAPSLTWKATDQTTLTLTSQIQIDDADSIASFLPHAGTVANANSGRIPRKLFIGDPDFEKFEKEQYSLGYMLEHKFSNQSAFRQNTRYSTVNLNYRTIYAQGSLQSNGFGGTTDDLARVPADIREDLKHFATDNQFENKFKTGDVAHTLLTGLDATFSEHENKTYGATRAAAQAFTLSNPFNWTRPSYRTNWTAAMLPLSTSNETERRKIGLYVQDQLKMDEWTVTAGLRHDWAKQEVLNRLTNARENQDDKALTGRFGLTYKFDNGFSPYANYATSFSQLSGTDAAGNLFDPEEAKQFEMGLRYQAPNDPFMVTLSAFDITRQNVKTTDPNNAAFSIQVGEVRNRGLELESQIELNNGVNILGAYTFMDAEITKDTSNAGNTPAAVPKHNAKIWASYSFDASSALSGVSLGGGVRYNGKAKANNANSLEVPSYTLVDAKLSYEIVEGTDLTLHASNLFNKDYVAACSSTNNCFYGDPRKITASLKFNW